MPRRGRPGRRTFVAGLTAALAGCARFRAAADRPDPSPVSVTIKTTPADDDPYAIRIARHLGDHLAAVGVRTRITPMTTEELLRTILVDHEFDLYVARHPGRPDPDFLRVLAHSRYGEEPGWQNPFGNTDIDADAALDQQRHEPPAQRRSTIDDVQWSLARTAPFTVVAHPDAVHAARTDRIRDWPSAGLQSPTDLLSLTPAGDHALDTLRIAITDPRVTINRNPLAVEFRKRGLVTGLLYEPLARWATGRLQPRLAREWEWRQREDSSVARVTLRDGTWHDGEPITAADVAFTYRFIADTTLGSGEVPVPAPRFRGRSTLVDDVAVVDDNAIDVRFDARSNVARRAFTVPILPAHVWRAKAEKADVAGVEMFGETTQALVWTNPNPVGSGPLAFEDAVEEESLVLSRVDDPAVGDPVAYDVVSFRVVPSIAAAVELVLGDEADVTGRLDASVVPRIGRADDATVVAGPSPAFYHVGYNLRRTPFHNAKFRQATAALLDREALLDDVFGGFASPSVSPLVGDWLASDLAWEGQAPVTPFPEDDGELDVAAARDLFRDAGYEFRDDGTMVA